jgi:hypothetical protein
MLEVAGGIVLAVVILVYFGGMHVLLAGLFGGLLVPAAAALAYLFRMGPTEIALGIVVAAVVIGSIVREWSEDREEGRT